MGRKVNLNQRRHALASAVAATACAPLVMARGHRVMGVSQLPLVLDDTVGQVAKTRDAVALLKSLGLWDDVRRVMGNKQLRCGKGKMRGRRHKMRRGPLFIVEEGCESLRRALRNVTGVDIWEDFASGLNPLSALWKTPSGLEKELLVTKK